MLGEIDGRDYIWLYVFGKMRFENVYDYVDLDKELV